RKTTTGSGKSRSTIEAVLWQTEQHVSAGVTGVDSTGRTIPVEFALPANAYVTDQDDSSDQVVWVLHAEAKLPGIDYSDDFEVPVFRTAASANAVAASSPSSGFPDASTNDADSSPATAPSKLQVVVSSQSGGTEFYFRAFRSPARALFLLFFTCLWTGIVYFLF